MSEWLYLDENGAYIWAAYAITLVVIVWNAFSARASLKRNLREAAQARSEEAPRRPTVRQL
jgi:heme exporter protein CcmD